MIGLYKSGVSIILILFALSADAGSSFAFRSGCSLSMGTHCNRIGIFAMGHYGLDRYQGGLRVDYFTVAKAWGHGKKGWETQLSGAAGIGYGKQIQSRNMYLDMTSSIVSYLNFFTYSYIIYIDSYQTSQQTGTILMQFGRVKISSENDFLGQGHTDKFRTAGFLFAYETDTIEIGGRLVLWTGDSFSKGVVKVTDSDYPARFGYKDLSHGLLGKFSVGTMGLQVRTDKYWGQAISMYAGADAEQFRNIFQNKFMHDLWFVPQKVISYKMMNYPMLNSHGLPYLHTPETGPVRPVRPLFQIGVNEPLFY